MTPKKAPSKKRAQRYTPSPMVNILFIGDSLIHGGSDPSGLGLVGRLQRRLRDFPYVYLYNRGVPRSDSIYWVLNATHHIREISALGPTIVVLWVGSNDASMINGKMVNDPANFEKNLQTIFGLLGEAVVIYALGHYTIDERRCNPLPSGRQFQNDPIHFFDDRILKVCLKHAGYSFFLTPRPLLVNRRAVLAADGVHLNGAGYNEVAKMLERQLRPLLQMILSRDELRKGTT